MTREKSFWRKVIYVALMVVLLIPMYLISNPATRNHPGGTLARLRTKHNLSQAKLGEIDPAGEAMKLALLGMRGIAVQILWGKSNHYKKTEDWTNFMATLEQITKLQPNFISVWQYQSWNVSYNVSVEFDNYLHRYYWVKRGIRYLVDGTRHNRDEPRLLWDIGWVFGQKIGRADEYIQFRREFRKDNEFHDFLREYVPVDECLGPDGLPDNWLVSRQWFLLAQDVVDTGRATLKGKSLKSLYEQSQNKKEGKSPVLFHSNPPMALINYSSAIQEDGYFDEVAQTAWESAHRDWIRYGTRNIRTSYGFDIRLSELEDLEAEVDQLRERLEQLDPGAEAQLIEEKRKQLSDEQRTALDTPPQRRDADQFTLAAEAQREIHVTMDDIAQHVPESARKQAQWLASRIDEKRNQARVIDQYRGIVNFKYWRTQCEVEQRDEANRAHKFLYRADQAYLKAQPVVAKKFYDMAFAEWAKIYEEFPSLLDDVGAEDLMDAVQQRYAQTLDQLDEDFPQDFPLKELIRLHEPEWRPWEEASTEPEE